MRGKKNATEANVVVHVRITIFYIQYSITSSGPKQ